MSVLIIKWHRTLSGRDSDSKSTAEFQASGKVERHMVSWPCQCNEWAGNRCANGQVN